VAALISSVNDHYLSSCFSKVTKGYGAAFAFESTPENVFHVAFDWPPLKGETGSYRPKYTLIGDYHQCLV